MCAGGQEQLTVLPATRPEPVRVEHEVAAAAAVSTRTGGGGGEGPRFQKLKIK